MSEEDASFRSATRRLLFKEPEKVQDIPGAGRSAAEESDKHVRVKVTINLDGDVISHFKARSKKEGVPYQTLINQTLREHMHGSRPEQLALRAAELLLEDEEFLTAIASRVQEKK